MNKSSSIEKRLHDSAMFFASDLFHDVQMSGIFHDSKVFADAQAKRPWSEIFALYKTQSQTADFDLMEFVTRHFSLPAADYQFDEVKSTTPRQQIQQLWSKLEKQPDTPKADSLLPLSHPYLVPGGRFREIYYWDSYFTALGLVASDRHDLVISMVENFIDLQTSIGCIPNGNRCYYATRSQPPILALMIELLTQQPPQSSNDSDFLPRALTALETEYAFWMQGVDQLTEQNPTHQRVVRMDNGAILNRYWDSSDLPRAESYREDIEAAQQLPYRIRGDYYRNIRAACESGWDFSSRWLKNPDDLVSIQTTLIVPVDLNSLMYKLETTLAQYCQRLGRANDAHHYHKRAAERKRAIDDYLWSTSLDCYLDFNLKENEPSQVLSLATAVPLFVGLASKQQATAIAARIEQDFLCQGGLVTTLCSSAQQWDAPNGWAPLQWFATEGLLRYGFSHLAFRIMRNWVATVEHQFAQHGNLMEKYDVQQSDRLAQGGEYEVQHGFGWTNGVTLAYYHYLGRGEDGVDATR